MNDVNTPLNVVIISKSMTVDGSVKKRNLITYIIRTERNSTSVYKPSCHFTKDTTKTAEDTGSKSQHV